MANALAPASATPSKPAASSGNLKRVQDLASSLERKLESAKGSVARMKENSGNAMEGVVMTLEIQGANAVGAMAEGYWGEEKMDLGSIDMRTMLGVGLAAKGLMDVMSGESGVHELALGNGFLAAGLGRMSRNAGRKLRESYDKDKAPADASTSNTGAAAPAPALDQQPPGEGWSDYKRVAREIVVASDEDEPPRRRRRERQGQRRRERGGERPAANNPWTSVSMAG